jgi:hypothetical protein
VEVIARNTVEQLLAFPKSEFQEYWDKCVCAEGAYFERDWPPIPVITVSWFWQIQFQYFLIRPHLVLVPVAF